MTELCDLAQEKCEYLEGDMMAESDKAPLLEEGGEDATFVARPSSYGSDESSKEDSISVQVRDSGREDSSRNITPFVYLLTFMSAIGGFLFGYDTGVVSGAMILLKDEFYLSSLGQELVVSITIGLAAVAAFIGGPLNNWLGRKPVILLASFVFTCGALILGCAYNRIMLLVGRAILGIGIGKSYLQS